jgi:phage tail-like protein
MASANVRARDPLRGYQFAVLVSGDGGFTTLGGVQRVSGLTCTVTAFEVWEGGNNLHRYANPDKISWDPVTLEQGLALDDTMDMWARSVRQFATTGATLPGVPVKRNVDIELRDPFAPTQWLRRYHLINAWISRYSALPRLDALTSEVALLSVELHHEGWKVELPSDTAS